MLAEKYLDFQILIEVCQKTNNKEKINYYIDKFKHQVNVKFVFGNYLFCFMAPVGSLIDRGFFGSTKFCFS